MNPDGWGKSYRAVLLLAVISVIVLMVAVLSGVSRQAETSSEIRNLLMTNPGGDILRSRWQDSLGEWHEWECVQKPGWTDEKHVEEWIKGKADARRKREEEILRAKDGK